MCRNWAVCLNLGSPSLLSVTLAPSLLAGVVVRVLPERQNSRRADIYKGISLCDCGVWEV